MRCKRNLYFVIEVNKLLTKFVRTTVTQGDVDIRYKPSLVINFRCQKSNSGSLKILLPAGVLKTIAASQIRKSTWLRRKSIKTWLNPPFSAELASSVHFFTNEAKTEYTFYLKFDFLLFYSLVLFRIGAVNRLMQVLIFVLES